MMIAIGDLHLTDSAGRGGLSQYLDDHDGMVADLVVSQPLKWARKNGVKHVLLLGDLCESPRMSYAAQKALARIFSQPFQFHVIPGNHDMFGPELEAGHSLEVLDLWSRPNVRLYTEITDVEIDGAPLRFLPWPHHQFSARRLNIAHIDVKGSRTDSGRLNDKETMPESKAWAVIGHIHTSQRVRNTIYPGTLYQTNFGEKAEKFFASIEHDRGGWDINLVPVKPTYRLHSLEVESRRDLQGIPASPQDLVKLIVKSQKVRAQDYQHLNVVKTMVARSDRELALARVEELSTGSQVEISSDEFFANWLEQQTRPDELKARAAALRSRLLKGVSQ